MNEDSYFVVSWSNGESYASNYGPEIYLTGVRINGTVDHLLQMLESTIGMEQWYRDIMEEVGEPCPKGECPALYFIAEFPVSGFPDDRYSADIYEYAVLDDGSIILT